jgi:hypothetical protein
MRCDCHGKEHRNLTVLLPSQRYVAIDPEAETPGGAIRVCAKWMAERERQHKAQQRRWAKGNVAA